jgi:hypothetical protein
VRRQADASIDELKLRYFVMAGLVPATHEHRVWIEMRGGRPCEH